MHTMATYQELLQQRIALDVKIKAARDTEMAEAIAKVRGIVSEFGLTAEDVFVSGRKTRSNAGQKVSPKYLNPETGQTWTGRGKAPGWIAQAPNREIYAIQQEQ